MFDWFISDTHFSHEKILQFEPDARPFVDIEAHDEFMIQAWNRRVKPDDTILHLGDVCFKPATRLEPVMSRLNGKKVLLLGNHDTTPSEEYLKYFDKLLSVYEDKKQGVIFSHYPLHPSQLEYRYKINVHGHSHSKVLDDKRYVNISCEHTTLAPIHVDDLYKIIQDRKGIVPTTGLKRSDLCTPYLEPDPRYGTKVWCVDESLYPESRGYLQHRFETEKEAIDFIEGTPE